MTETAAETPQTVRLKLRKTTLDKRLNRILPVRLTANVQTTDTYLLVTTETAFTGIANCYFFHLAFSSHSKLMIFCIPIVMASMTEANSPA